VCGFVRVAKAQAPLPDDLNPGANRFVYAMVVQLDGKILVGGAFTNLAGQARDRIGRLNGDGSLDADLNPGASGPSYARVHTNVG
jgi:hypothetical protein